MKDGLVLKLSLYVLPPLIGIVSRLWFATCRVTVHGQEHCRSTIDERKPVVATFWHYSLLVIFQMLRNYSGVIMVSASRDGEYIARLAKFLGFSVVRGSRNKNGVQALKELLRAAKKGHNTAIVADGSQGPPRIAQPGAILLASRTGNPVLPMAWSASSYLTIRSWDKTAFPNPFSRVAFIYGEPLAIPAGISAEEIEQYRLELEDRLNGLYEKMWKLHDRVAH